VDSISEFALFRAIVDAGGVFTAALTLRSSPPAVSRQLMALVTELGVRLADWSARRCRLTDEGLLLYERSRVILEQVRDAEAEVTSRGGAARGLLKVGAPVDLGRTHLSPVLTNFVAQHPRLDGHLIPSNAGLENESDGCDIVLRFGLPNNPTMTTRKIGTTSPIVVAAPLYIARRETSSSLDALQEHNSLRLARRHRLNDVWRFMDGEESIEVLVRGTLSSADGAALRGWALSGEGISWEALWDVADDLPAGGLLELLAEHRSAAMDLYAVFAPGRPVPPRIRLFVDFLILTFNELERKLAGVPNQGDTRTVIAAETA
jgi:LysR family transcriptional regulator, transcriptional activator for dmlA